MAFTFVKKNGLLYTEDLKELKEVGWEKYLELEKNSEKTYIINDAVASKISDAKSAPKVIVFSVQTCSISISKKLS